MKRHFLRRESSRRLQEPLTLKSSTDSQVEFDWTPELFGPIIETEKVTLWQALRTHLIERRTKIMASFVPDELIYSIDLTKKYLNMFISVVLLIDISSCHELWQQFRYMKNDGSYGMNKLFNTKICSIIEIIYLSNGDIINFESHGIMAIWKVQKLELLFKTVEFAIKCALKFQDIEKESQSDTHSEMTLKIAISAGEVGFSVIGNENGRHWVLIGQPVEDVRILIKDCNAGDVVLSESAWEYVSPNNYEHVVTDPNTILILRETGAMSRLERKTVSMMIGKASSRKISNNLNREEVSFIGNSMVSLKANESHWPSEESCWRVSIKQAVSRKLTEQLKSFLTPVLINHIEKDRLLEDICHNRRVTIMSINVVPMKCTNLELLNLCDECFISLLRLTAEYGGRVESVVAYSKSIFFNIIFGPLIGDITNEYASGITCAEKCLKLLNNIERIKKTSIGVSTGVVIYTIVGDFIRHAYFCLGLPIEKAEKISAVSNQRVGCDFDTVLYSDIPRRCFRIRSIKGITGFGKFHIYQLHYSNWSEEDHWIDRKINDVYPIVGRIEELDKFTDILDGICSSQRNYCGFLIQGDDRVGKSRLLDEFVLIAKSRQISVHRLSLNSRDSSRSFSTIHQVLLNIFNTESYDTIEKREKICVKKFGCVSSSRKFCYLNAFMYVNFPSTQSYLIENKEQHVTKTLQIFDDFLGSIEKPNCIFLDDVHFVDDESWPFICNIMKQKNFLLIMTINSSEGKSLQNNLINDSRIYKCILGSLKPDEIYKVVCQFLDVHAVSKKFCEILKRQSKNHPGWCEIFICLMLERKWLDFQYPDRKGSIKDLISPPIGSIAKLPYGVFPDEINHDLPYYKRRAVHLNLRSESFINKHPTLSIVDIYRTLFSFLTTYEQDLLQNAAVLGDVFFRDTLETVMTESTDLQIAQAITRLMELRIIECASVQRFNYEFSPHMKRSTFSDMHHLIHCACYRTNAGKKVVKEDQTDLPDYSRCKWLEFKAKNFRNFVYDEIMPSKRRNLHTIVAEVYERQAKRCNSCGGGSFLKAPSTSRMAGIAQTGSIMRQSIAREFTRFGQRRRTASVGSQEAHAAARDRKISICDEPEDQSVSIPESNKKKSEKIFDAKYDPSMRSQLKKFNTIDFRNCECEKNVMENYTELIWHLEKLDDSSRYVKWVLELAAAMIQIYRCTEALKILAIAKEHNENLSPDERWSNASIISGLMGDASASIGNNSDAENYFLEAIKMQNDSNFVDRIHRISNKFCRYWRRIFHSGRDIFAARMSRDEIFNRLTIAHYLVKLSKIYLSHGDINHAESTALHAFEIGFSCPNEGFIEKCSLFINTTIIFRTIGEWKLVQSLEKRMIDAMRKKSSWSYIDEILSVVHVLQLMFELRTLRGENENAYNIGIKILKIAGTLHLTGITLVILPPLIQLAVCMKRVYQAADLMGQLYYLSVEDIDESSITWYYSLSLDLALDAGMALEPFDKSVEHAKTILKCKYRACVSRDPESLKRLLTCLWIWQLRMGKIVTAIFPQSSTSYTSSIKSDNYSQILTLSKGLGCYLLVLRRHINIKNSTDLPDLVENINLLLKTLEMLSRHAWFIKPRLFMLKAYLRIIHGDTCAAMKLLRRGKRHAVLQGNEMMVAWLQQSEMTFRMQQYNVMAQYWAEHASTVDDFNWRNIQDFDSKAWSTILYPIPVPESYL